MVPTGQAEPIPDPFIEAITRGEAPATTEGIQELQGKSFQLGSKFEDFAPVVVGMEGQRVSVRFTAVVLPNGNCAVTRYQALGLARTSKNQISPVGSSEVASLNGFTVRLGDNASRNLSQPSRRVIQ